MITIIVGAECTESIWSVNFEPKPRQQFTFNHVMNVSIVSHLRCFAAAFKHGIQVYNVPFGAHYTQRIKTTQSWVLTDVSMATRHWMGRGEVRSVLCLEWLFRSRWLSHRSARNGDGGHLWKPPPSASTNTVQPTGWEHLHAFVGRPGLQNIATVCIFILR